MLRLDHFSVSTRLTAMAGLGLLALGIVAGVGALGNRESARAATGVIDRELALVEQFSHLRAASGDLRRYEKDVIIHFQDARAVEAYLAKWQDGAKRIADAATRIQPLVEGEDHRRLKELLAGVDDYRRGMDAMVTRLRAGEFSDSQAANKALEPAKAGVRAVEERAQELIGSVRARVEARRAALEAASSRQTTLGGIAVLVAAVLLAGTARAIARSVIRPLARVTHSLERVAEGDLTETIQVQGRDELAGLQRRLGDTQASLRHLVQLIQDNAASVATASAQIAQGNTDLSSRTEQQAASLQQSAASMEELTGTVRHSADTAHRASELAQSASRSATRGGAAVAQVESTMTGIQAASRRITDIIGVIDGIAFQTNILALNAAVEAARAGEQGRGFAVVASEVRTLAQRSAEAARQIKSLIGDSSTRVEAGAQCVDDAGQAMRGVVDEVQRVCALIAEISAASSEQSLGIGQVGQAVATLDQTTQQNAALVEESAAAAESLKTQAARLNETAASFRLGAA